MFFMNRNNFYYFEHRWEDTVEKEIFQIFESWAEISFLRSFSIVVGELLDSVNLFESREYMILINSYLPVNIRKKESSDWKNKSSDLLLRKLEKFLYE